jgi:hypothetical protein
MLQMLATNQNGMVLSIAEPILDVSKIFVGN